MTDNLDEVVTGQLLGMQMTMLAVLMALDKTGEARKGLPERLQDMAAAMVNQNISDPNQINLFYEAAQAIRNFAILIETHNK